MRTVGIGIISITKGRVVWLSFKQAQKYHDNHDKKYFNKHIYSLTRLARQWKNTKTALTLHYSYPDRRDFSQAGKSQLTSFLELEVSGRNIIHIKLNLLIQVLIYLLTAVNFVYFKTTVFCNYGLSWLT